MIASLTGTVLQIAGNSIVIDVQGVGYELGCTENLLSKLEVGAKASCIVYTEVKEDAIRLYGFWDLLEKQVFLLLLKVKGVGVRTALEIISTIDRSAVLEMIAEENSSGLMIVKGLGRKSVERIILELKDLAAQILYDQPSRNDLKTSPKADISDFASDKVSLQARIAKEALLALCALGFSIEQSKQALKQLEGKLFPDAGSMVKDALRFV